MSVKKRKQLKPEPDPKFDPRANLIGVFSLLLEIDKRVNPQNHIVRSRPKNHA
jgi:hypothetical protein